ncbi:MAG: TIR domain-containing protein [Thermoleophilaceae bacterium]
MRRAARGALGRGRLAAHQLAERDGARPTAKLVQGHHGQYGPTGFADSQVVETGDQLEAELKTALHDADELLVLLTPAALERPYVWIEIGAAWSQGKRIIGILHGMTTSELAGRDGTPAFLTGIVLRDINELEEYLGELRQRLTDG